MALLVIKPITPDLIAQVDQTSHNSEVDPWFDGFELYVEVIRKFDTVLFPCLACGQNSRLSQTEGVPDAPVQSARANIPHAKHCLASLHHDCPLG